MGKYNYIRRSITWEGKRYEVYGKTEREAADKLAALKASLKRGERTVGANSTVDRWFQEWFELYKKPTDLTPKSLGMYAEKYRLYIQPRIGKMKLKDVKDVHLQRILNEEAGKSRSHVNKIRLVMKELFSRARKSRRAACQRQSLVRTLSPRLNMMAKACRKRLTKAPRQMLLPAVRQAM